MEKTIKFLKIIKKTYQRTNDKLIVYGDIYLNINIIEEGVFDNCDFRNYLVCSRSLKSIPENFIQNSILRNILIDNINQISKGFLKNTIIYGFLALSSLEYWPKDFYPNVRGTIYVDNLKSKTIKKLIKLSGINRELGFNLINSLNENTI